MTFSPDPSQLPFLCVILVSPLHYFCSMSPRQALPGMSYGEASPLSDALVDHQLAEEARRASRWQFGRRGTPPSSHHTWHLRGLQLQVHVLLECPDAGVHLNTELIGWHPCRLGSVLNGTDFYSCVKFCHFLVQNSASTTTQIQMTLSSSWHKGGNPTLQQKDRAHLTHKH